MPGFHWPELILLVAVALLIFGPKRLPEMGASIGKTIKEFQKSMKEVTEPTPTPTPAVTTTETPQQIAPSPLASTPVVTSTATTVTETTPEEVH